MAEAALEPRSAPAVPADAGERLPTLDLVRGVALCGILLANIPHFYGPGEFAADNAVNQSLGDRVVVGLTHLFIDQKFITLFSILFGAGLAIQTTRARAAGRPFAWYYVRRMFLLYVIGLTHALFIWYGDILASYAIVGLVALAVSYLSQRGVFWVMVACLGWVYFLLLAVTVVIVLLTAIYGNTPLFTPPQPDPAEAAQMQPLERPISLLGTVVNEWPTNKEQGEVFGKKIGRYFTPENLNLIYRGNHFWLMVENRWVFVASSVLFFWPVLLFYLLACFLIGLLLLRHGVFHEPAVHPVLVRRLIGIGLGIGVPIHVAVVTFSWFNPELASVAELFRFWGVLPQALAYLGLLLVWSQSGWLPWLQARFRAVGRMALTNYLMQSVLCTFFFYGWGLGYYGYLDRVQALGVVVAVWLLELLWSPVWLRYFRMGPVEWLWRSLAEGRLKPFRNRPETPHEGPQPPPVA